MARGGDIMLGEAYAAEIRRRCRLAAITASRLGMALVPAFAVLDAVLFPHRLALFACVRAGCLAGIACLWWVLERPFGHRRPELVALGVALLIVATIDVMIALSGGIASRYWAGLPLVLLGVTVLMPWRAIWPVAATLCVLASYVITVFAAGPAPDGVELTSNLCFLVSTGIIATVGARRASRLQWREFVQRTALEDALRHKSDFMAKMSHELRTPLHAIVGYADILLEDAHEEADARHLVERIRSRGTFLHRLISDLLDFAKVEAGRMDVRREPVQVARVVEQTLATFRPLIDRKGLEVAVRLADDVPLAATDPHRLEQVVGNLLANALKFTERGRITVEVRLAEPPLADFTLLGAVPRPVAGPMIGILVTDTGVGIRTADLRELARDFQQVDGVSERFGGTGLGLSISRRLVDLLDGRLLVRSHPGTGSTFAVLLPIATAAGVVRSRHAA